MVHVGFGSGVGIVCEQLKNNFECTVLGSLPKDGCAIVEFEIYVFSTQMASILEIQGAATTDTTETMPNNDSVAYPVTITLLSNVRFVQLSPVVATAGTVEHYDLYVGNSGPSMAYGVTLTSVSPFDIVDWAQPSIGSCNRAPGANRTLVCNLGNLMAEQQGPTLGVFVSVLISIPPPTAATIRASAESPSSFAYSVEASFTVTSPDVSDNDNAQSFPVDVLQVSDLLMAANCSQTQSAFTLTNTGPSDCAAYALVIRPGAGPSM